MSFSMTLRSSIAVASLALAGAAQAGNTTIVTNALVADSVQAFSDTASKAFKLTATQVSGAGNTVTVAGAALPTFSFPITSITVDSKLNIVKGDAKGSALKFERTLDDGSTTWVILANFTIDYSAKKVLADATIPGVPTAKQQAIYTFNTNTPLSIKYKFPLAIVGHEVLDTLKLTEETKDTFLAGLALDDYLRAVLDKTDFGTLTQDVAVKLRPKAVSTKPYTVAQPAAQ